MQSRGQSKTKAGKTYNNTYCHVFRLAGGKVQECGGVPGPGSDYGSVWQIARWQGIVRVQRAETKAKLRSDPQPRAASPNEPLHVTAARWRFRMTLNGSGGAAPPSGKRWASIAA